MESGELDIRVCRRRNVDRRRCTAKTAVMSVFRSRRAGERRDTPECTPAYVDLHEPQWLITSLAIMLLCVADAYFTMALITFGGQELNPFMAHFLEAGSGQFFFVKYTLTAASLFLLLAHRNFRLAGRVTGSWVITMVLGTYVLLIIYELILLSRIPLF